MAQSQDEIAAAEITLAEMEQMLRGVKSADDVQMTSIQAQRITVVLLTQILAKLNQIALRPQ